MTVSVTSPSTGSEADTPVTIASPESVTPDFIVKVNAEAAPYSSATVIADAAARYASNVPDHSLSPPR